MRVKIITSRDAPALVRDFLSRLARGHAPSIKVQRQQTPYWQLQGWTRSGDQYFGNYQTPYGAFQGLAEQRGRNYFRFYIFNPPTELQGHSHWSCFVNKGSNRYEVHMGKQPSDISSGIMTIERLISEAFD